MNLIEQEVRNITQTDFSYKGIMKFVERVGRICTNSNHRITEDSWIDFVEKLRRQEHWSVFGHATAYFKIPKSNRFLVKRIKFMYKSYPLRVRYGGINGEYIYLVCSVRCIEENKHGKKMYDKVPTWEMLKPYLIEPTEQEVLVRQSLFCTSSIAVTRELNRHGWNLDIMEKSTRYTECFDIIKPYWYDSQKWYTKFLYKMTCKIAFINYKILLKLGLKKQDARGVLPLDTATQVIYTAFNYQWQDVIAKRTTSGVHPDCRQLVEMARKELK